MGVRGGSFDAIHGFRVMYRPPANSAIPGLTDGTGSTQYVEKNTFVEAPDPNAIQDPRRTRSEPPSSTRDGKLSDLSDAWLARVVLPPGPGSDTTKSKDPDTSTEHKCDLLDGEKAALYQLGHFIFTQRKPEREIDEARAYDTVFLKQLKDLAILDNDTEGRKPLGPSFLYTKPFDPRTSLDPWCLYSNKPKGLPELEARYTERVGQLKFGKLLTLDKFEDETAQRKLCLKKISLKTLKGWIHEELVAIREKKAIRIVGEDR